MQLFHTTSAYSISGRIKEKYIVWRDFLSNLNFSFRITFIRAHAFVLICSRCSCHVQSLEKIIPKCLWDVTSFICFWSIKTGGWCGSLTFLEKSIYSDFPGLNVTSHCFAQRFTFSRSELCCSAACMGSSTIMYRLVSSANSLIEELIFSTISLIYKRNNKGPRIEPWGTPALIGVHEELPPW